MTVSFVKVKQELHAVLCI